MVYELKSEITEDALILLNDTTIDPGWRVSCAMNNLKFKPSMELIDDLISAVKSHEEIVNPINVIHGDVLIKAVDNEDENVSVMVVNDHGGMRGHLFVKVNYAKTMIRQYGYRLKGHIDLPQVD